ncbi:uncharacterized, partial [Tachysurus ichikawai]
IYSTNEDRNTLYSLHTKSHDRPQNDIFIASASCIVSLPDSVAYEDFETSSGGRVGGNDVSQETPQI